MKKQRLKPSFNDKEFPKDYFTKEQYDAIHIENAQEKYKKYLDEFNNKVYYEDGIDPKERSFVLERIWDGCVITDDMDIDKPKPTDGRKLKISVTIYDKKAKLSDIIPDVKWSIKKDKQTGNRYLTGVLQFTHKQYNYKKQMWKDIFLPYTFDDFVEYEKYKQLLKLEHEKKLLEIKNKIVREQLEYHCKQLRDIKHGNTFVQKHEEEILRAVIGDPFNHDKSGKTLVK